MLFPPAVWFPLKRTGTFDTNWNDNEFGVQRIYLFWKNLNQSALVDLYMCLVWIGLDSIGIFRIYVYYANKFGWKWNSKFVGNLWVLIVCARVCVCMVFHASPKNKFMIHVNFLLLTFSIWITYTKTPQIIIKVWLVINLI